MRRLLRLHAGGVPLLFQLWLAGRWNQEEEEVKVAATPHSKNLDVAIATGAAAAKAKVASRSRSRREGDHGIQCLGFELWVAPTGS